MNQKAIEKLRKDNPEFVAEVDGLDVAALDKRLSTLAKGQEAIQVSKEADEKLAKAKEEAALLGAPYREARKANSVKMKYIINLINEKSVE